MHLLETALKITTKHKTIHHPCKLIHLQSEHLEENFKLRIQFKIAIT